MRARVAPSADRVRLRRQLFSLWLLIALLTSTMLAFWHARDCATEPTPATPACAGMLAIYMQGWWFLSVYPVFLCAMDRCCWREHVDEDGLV